MKKEELIQSVKIIALGFILSLGMSFVYAEIPAGTWNPPSGTPSSANNIAPAISTGSASQTKTGDLGVNGTFYAANSTTIMNSSGISTGSISASDNSVFSSKMYIGGIPPTTLLEQNQTFDSNIIIGKNETPSYVAKLNDFLGLTPKKALALIPDQYVYDFWSGAPTLTVAGDMQTNGSIYSSNLIGAGERPVCVGSSGELKLCGTGECGVANGQPYGYYSGGLTDDAPATTDLCGSSSYLAPNTFTNVGTGGFQGPWTWKCKPNIGAGASVSCSTKQVPAPTDGNQVFTSSGTFTIPVGVMKLHFEAVGGGGAGGSTTTSYIPSNGPYPASGSGGSTKVGAVTLVTGGAGGYGGAFNGEGYSQGYSGCLSESNASGGTYLVGSGNVGNAGTLYSGGSAVVSGYGNVGHGGNAGPINQASIGHYASCYGIGGGGGGHISNYPMTTATLVTSSLSRKIPITVGAGGWQYNGPSTGGPSSTMTELGYNGNSGLLKVFWYADNH